MLEIEYNPDYAFELRHEGQKAKEIGFSRAWHNALLW